MVSLVKLPNPLKVGAYKFKVEFDPSIPVNYNGSYGYISPVQATIGVTPGLTDVQRFATLIHEVLHQINKTYNCNLDEGNTDRIAEGLTDFLRDTLGLEFDWSEIASKTENK